MKLLTDFYGRKVCMSNWELTIFKLAVFCLAIAIGCYFADFFRPYLVLLIAVGAATGLWITVVWLKAMKEIS